MTYTKTTARQRKDEAARKVRYHHISMRLVTIADKSLPAGFRVVTERQANGNRGATYAQGRNQQKRSSPMGRRKDVIRRLGERFQHAREA